MKKIPIFLLVFLILVAMAVPGLAAYRVYRVQPRNTVSQIATWYGLTGSTLAQTNRLPDPGFIIPRQVLLIPDPVTGPDEQLHLVKPGDTLQKLAVRYNTSLQWLLDHNYLPGGILYAGQMIKVPAAPKPAAQPRKPAQTGNTPGSSSNSYVWNIPALMARHPGRIFLNGPASQRKVALTFDDGPDATYTPAILDLLAELGVKATFFLRGDRIPGREWVVQRIINEGHIIGNHTQTHANLRKLSLARLQEEVLRTEELIAAQTGLRPALIRPPYGEMSESGLDWLTGAGYVMTNWSVDSGDWRAENADQIMINILPDLNPGSVILLHCAGGTGQDLTPTVNATEDLIYTLWGLGYEITTLPQLLSVPAYH
ncbi:MAG TPA: polysaccharide deacetylase family protein [Firmicutes bacterium]|jgi:peptidoglycan/xylan/chitin deacetylase (PgdA/CDA1 family)|nr:polysaccharide deacetylase family protein [Bacillota bacterium]